MKYLFLLSSIFLLFNGSINPKKENFEHNYAGKIGKYTVYMNLKARNNTISGTYFYANKGIEINLTDGKVENDRLTCFETDYLKNKTAKITATLKNGVLNGTWKNLVTQKELPVQLQVSKLKYKPLPKQIAGNYSVSNTESEGNCKIDIKISYVKGEYLYFLKTDKRKRNGKIYFSRSEDGNYITFSGLPGDENQGDLQGLLNEGKISIQNYGNSMNEYVRLSECGDKYIHLVKK
ncbi:hypothetical protein [Pedobacter punctiformis]|uniref:Lipocalin-like domain-containing protein n=1 Tax=Pedobacter punctiformis TaxID=3004097 RepID=A0ABT4LAE0_9SPHI|nr:hypothetical protein [Pedobacter sp. HCMS5-2]MCZ4244897.1 hypothetical protein [Pedobacter sp. HCMS5-2]